MTTLKQNLSHVLISMIAACGIVASGVVFAPSAHASHGLSTNWGRLIQPDTDNMRGKIRVNVERRGVVKLGTYEKGNPSGIHWSLKGGVSPGRHVVKTQRARCGESVYIKGAALLRSGKIERSRRTYILQPVNCPVTDQVATSWNGEGDGVADANQVCPGGSVNHRVWVLSRADAGSIEDPGVLTVLMEDGTQVFVDGANKLNIYTWEFHQFGNGEINLDSPEATYTIATVTTPYNQSLTLELAFSGCTGTGV